MAVYLFSSADWREDDSRTLGMAIGPAGSRSVEAAAHNWTAGSLRPPGLVPASTQRRRWTTWGRRPDSAISSMRRRWLLARTAGHVLSNEDAVEPHHRAIARLPHSRAARTRHAPSHRASCVIAMMRIEMPAFQELALGSARSEVERIGAVKVWPLPICRGTKLQPCGNRPDPAFSSTTP